GHRPSASVATRALPPPAAGVPTSRASLARRYNGAAGCSGSTAYRATPPIARVPRLLRPQRLLEPDFHLWLAGVVHTNPSHGHTDVHEGRRHPADHFHPLDRSQGRAKQLMPSRSTAVSS